MVASQAHRLLLPWKLQAHLNNINYPSDFNQPSQRSKPNYLYKIQMHARSSVSDQQGACNVNVSISVFDDSSYGEDTAVLTRNLSSVFLFGNEAAACRIWKCITIKSVVMFCCC